MLVEVEELVAGPVDEMVDPVLPLGEVVTTVELSGG